MVVHLVLMPEGSATMLNARVEKEAHEETAQTKCIGHETAGGVADGRGLAAALIESVAANGVLRRR